MSEGQAAFSAQRKEKAKPKQQQKPKSKSKKGQPKKANDDVAPPCEDDAGDAANRKRSAPDDIPKLSEALEALLKDTSLELPQLDDLVGHVKPPQWVKSHNVYSAVYKACYKLPSGMDNVTLCQDRAKLATRIWRAYGVCLPELLLNHTFKSTPPAKRARKDKGEALQAESKGQEEAEAHAEAEEQADDSQ